MVKAKSKSYNNPGNPVKGNTGHNPAGGKTVKQVAGQDPHASYSNRGQAPTRTGKAAETGHNG